MVSILVESQEEQPLRKIVGMSRSLACDEEKRKKSRLERAWKGVGGRMPRNARVREKRSREEGGRRVRPGFACQTIREIALASLSARSTPSRGQSAQLTLSSAQRGQQEERGLFHMCVSIVRVCIGARSSGPKRRSATCRESFGHITLNTKGWFYLTRLT